MSSMAVERRGHKLAAGLAAALAFASLPAWGAVRVSEGKRPRPVRVAAGGDSVVASQGSYCVTSRHSGTCADYAYPLRVKGRLPVAPGDAVLLRTGDRAIHRARITLIHARRHDFRPVARAVTARRVAGHRARLRFRLPDDLGNANRIDIAATYAHHRGDSDWWAGIRPQLAP